MEQTFEEYMQTCCGGQYAVSDILNNLEWNEIVEMMQDFAENREKIVLGKEVFSKILEKLSE